MDPQILKKINQAKVARKAFIHLTELTSGRDRLIFKDEVVSGMLGERMGEAFASGKSRVVEIESQEYFLNVHVPKAKIIVIGAVHIAQALAPIARIANYDLLIIDPRSAFATKERFEGVEVQAEWPEVIIGECLDPFTALVALSHDPKIDDTPIRAALNADCFYVGALGSRKTHAKRGERMKKVGMTDTQIAQIQSPIGLDIGAANPAEIAVAIMAQIIVAHRKPGAV